MATETKGHPLTFALTANTGWPTIAFTGAAGKSTPNSPFELTDTFSFQGVGTGRSAVEHGLPGGSITSIAGVDIASNGSDSFVSISGNGKEEEEEAEETAKTITLLSLLDEQPQADGPGLISAIFNFFIGSTALSPVSPNTTLFSFANSDGNGINASAGTPFQNASAQTHAPGVTPAHETVNPTPQSIMHDHA